MESCCAETTTKLKISKNRNKNLFIFLTTLKYNDVLLKQLKDLRKKISKKHQIPPFAVFQDSSLDDMTMQYPTTVKELTNVFGVGEGKAQKFGKEFVDFIAQYVKDNDIIRPEDMVIKQVADKSSHKVYIIQ